MKRAIVCPATMKRAIVCPDEQRLAIDAAYTMALAGGRERVWGA